MDQRLFVSICFFLSGVAALMYEVVWSKMLTTIFGASLYAVATTTAVFLGGLALGAFLAGRVTRLNTTTKRLQAYAIIEVITALFGAVIVPLCLQSTWLPNAWAHVEASGQPGISYLLRFLVTSVFLLPPSALMGATLPLLVGAFVPKNETHDSTTQLLYALNTTGGAVGSIAAGFGMLPAVGLMETSMIVAILNVVCALGGLVAITAKPLVEQPTAPKKTANAPPLLAKTSTIVAVSFLSGLILLQLEVCWTRWCSLILGSSVYSFSLILAIFLISLSVGAWSAKKLLQRLGNGLLLLSTAYFLSSTYILIALYSANEIPWSFVQLCQSLHINTFAGELWARIIIICAMIAPPATLLGTVLPLLLGAQVENKQDFVGRTYAVNVAGCICGSLITGFVLIPALSALAGTGIRWTMILNLCAQLLISCWLFMEWARQFVTDPDTRSIVVGIVIFVAVAVIIDVALFRPEWNPAVAAAGASFFSPDDMKKLDKETFYAAIGALEDQDTLRFYREGVNATVSVAQDSRRNVAFLKTDGKVEAAVPLDPLQPSHGSDSTTHLLLGALPAQLVTARPSTGLVIGYGSGTTSGAALANPDVMLLTVAELESAVFTADKFFRQSNGSPLEQAGRIHPITNDGRYVLLASPLTYDFIVCQPSDPWVAGSADLFTDNFWQLAKVHLKPGGMLTQWLQLYSISPQEFTRLIKTFAQVFPNCAVVLPQRAGECVLLASIDSKPLTREQIRDALAKTEHDTSDKLPANYRSLAGIINDATILEPSDVQKIASSSDLKPNTDDHNLIEYSAAQAAMTQGQNISDNALILQRAAALSR